MAFARRLSVANPRTACVYMKMIKLRDALLEMKVEVRLLSEIAERACAARLDGHGRMDGYVNR